MDDPSSADPAPSGPPNGPPADAPSRPASRPRRSRRWKRARLTFDSPRVPEETSAWLHVVSGPSPSIVARGVLEMAARLLAEGHRVLIVDGGPRLQLHDRFDREMRWGVIECLTGEMPVLGLVQDVGRLGLYLLAHGLPAPHPHWLQLGRLLDEARPHFGRAVVALEPDAPPSVGEALVGRHLEGWWGTRGKDWRNVGKLADRLSDRLGIHFSPLVLDAVPHARLETLDVRLWSLIADRPLGDDEPEPEVVPEVAPAMATVTGTLDCDLRVSERLRFLLWMRRIQNEGQGADPPPASKAPNIASA